MLRKYYTILLFFSLFVFPVFSTELNKVNTEEANDKYTPCSLTINYTDTIGFSINKYLFFFPKIELLKTNFEWKNYNPTPSLDFFSRVNQIKENYQEITSLSKTLGIKIQDPSHLELYRKAADWLGTRYRYGGMSKKGTDCSGFTKNILKEVYGKDIDRSSYSIANKISQELNIEELQPGDLVFFTTRGRKRINHVGVYLGERCFIHASIKQGVIVSSLDDHYYSRTFKKAGRI